MPIGYVGRGPVGPMPVGYGLVGGGTVRPSPVKLRLVGRGLVRLVPVGVGGVGLVVPVWLGGFLRCLGPHRDLVGYFGRLLVVGLVFARLVVLVVPLLWRLIGDWNWALFA